MKVELNNHRLVKLGGFHVAGLDEIIRTNGTNNKQVKRYTVLLLNDKEDRITISTWNKHMGDMVCGRDIDIVLSQPQQLITTESSK